MRREGCVFLSAIPPVGLLAAGRVNWAWGARGCRAGRRIAASRGAAFFTIPVSGNRKGMSMKLVIGAVTARYADFSGRARRKEYWLFVLAVVIITLAVKIIEAFAGPNSTAVVFIVTGLALLVPGLAVTVRRLHDTDRSWAWILVQLVPIAGAIWFLVLMCLRGTEGGNRFGPDPLASGGD